MIYIAVFITALLGIVGILCFILGRWYGESIEYQKRQYLSVIVFCSSCRWSDDKKQSLVHEKCPECGSSLEYRLESPDDFLP